MKTSKKVRDTLTDCKAELEHMDSPFLLQKVHKTEEKVLLFSDFLQLQFQHLMREREGSRERYSKLHNVLKHTRSAYCAYSIY